MRESGALFFIIPDSDDLPLGMPHGIVPLGVRDESDPYFYHIVGTAFWISPVGVFLTAKHCVERDGEIIQGGVVFQPVPPPTGFYVRNIETIVSHPEADLALGFVEELRKYGEESI
jgi:hypothetical protein